MFESKSPSGEEMRELWGHRMMSAGVEYNDFVRTIRRIPVYWRDWCREWSATGAMHEALAREHEAQGNLISAAEAHYQAALDFHFACLHFIWDPEQWAPAHTKRVELYQKAAPHLNPPAERHVVPFGELRMPAHLRRPRGVERPPVVLLNSGTDSTKEEHRTFEDYLLRRGLATFTWDGPGQGETWLHAGMPPDFERSTSACIDYLETLDTVDARRVGLFGHSLGGYLAARGAATEPRLKACAISGGSYDRSHVLNYVDDEPQMAPNIRCPFLIVHGTKDFVKVSQAQRLYDEASSEVKELLLLEGGYHCCTNYPYLFRPQVADFMVKHLAGAWSVERGAWSVELET